MAARGSKWMLTPWNVWVSHVPSRHVPAGHLDQRRNAHIHRLDSRPRFH